jgi:hypothetical protein
MDTVQGPGDLALRSADDGCAYILDERCDQGGSVIRCGARCRAGSSYCPTHHALCHLASGSAAERRLLRRAEALADAVGGKRGRPSAAPPERFLRRLDYAVRALSRPNRSRYVPEGGDAEARTR